MTEDDWRRVRMYVAFGFLLLWISAALAWLIYLKHEKEIAYRHLIQGHIEGWKAFVRGRKPSVGKEGAPITIIEFSDYQCPVCASTEPILQSSLSKHPEDVVLYRLNLPLDSIHPYAHKAAIAAECAEDQDVLEPYQQALFRNQKKLATLSYAALAAENGVKNAEVFKACVEQEKPMQKIDRDMELAMRLGISVTPTVLINGDRVRGGFDADELEEVYAHKEHSFK